MIKVFGYKVFRHKLIMMVAGVLLIDILLATVCYFMLRTNWIGLIQNQGIRMNQAIEERLQREDDLLALQIIDAYSSLPLMEDIRDVFDSRTLDEYLDARLTRSRRQTAAIRSFPEYIRSYVRMHKSTLYKMVFFGESKGRGKVNMMHFDNSGIVYEFDISDETPGVISAIEDGFQIRKTIYNPADNHEIIGDISFFFRTFDILADVDLSAFTWSVLIDDTGKRYFLKGNESQDGALLERILEAEENTGFLSNGIWNTAYFSKQLSGQFSFELISCVDNKTLMRANASFFVTFAAVIFVLSAVSILIFIYNIRYDAIFIDHIFETIHATKLGALDSVGHMNNRYRVNEYGRIARELDDMNQKLKQYILSEYQLKIRQQQTEMRALQNQINPHFLYNMLESISAHALVNDDRSTADAITALGSLYRDIVNMPSQITLRDEMNMLKTYLKIMEFKSTGNFYYQMSLEPKAEDFATVKFWLQPLAENFFKHGFDSDHAYNLLIVRVYYREETLCIDMIDNGSPLPEDRLQAINESLGEAADTDTNIGLRNVYSRLSFFYGDRLSVRISNNEDDGVKVSVWITGNS